MKKDRLLILIFPALLMLLVVLEPIRGFHSPYLTMATSLIAIATGLLFGVLLLLVHKFIDRGWGKALFTLLAGSIVLFYLDIFLSASPWFWNLLGVENGVRPWWGTVLLLAIAATAALAVFFSFWKFRQQTIEFLTVLFVVMVGSAFFLTSHAPLDNFDRSGERAMRGEKPDQLTIYIVLDSMIGTAGLRQDIEGNHALADEVEQFLAAHEFVNYERAYSRHTMTFRAVPALLNGLYEDIPETDGVFAMVHNRGQVIANKLFDRLREEGNPVQVYQTDYIGYCQHPAVAKCETNSFTDPFSPHLEESKIPQSAALIPLLKFEQLLARSITGKIFVGPMFRPIRAIAKRFAPVSHDRATSEAQYGELIFDSLFDRFADDVLSAPGGNYFAHFIMPHYPYRAGEDCKPIAARFTEDKFSRLTEIHNLPPDEAARQRVKLYGEYRGQVRCVLNKLGTLFGKLKEQQRFDDARIVLIGDHGSRISNATYTRLLSRKDLIDNHSALFAHKARSGTADSDPRMLPIQYLVLGHASEDAEKDGVAAKPSVVTDGSYRADPSIVPMPEF